MQPTKTDIERLIKAIEGTRMITRLIDERIALKLSKIDGVVHEGVWYDHNVIPIKDIGRSVKQLPSGGVETIGTLYVLARDGKPEDAVMRFDYCSIETKNGMTWVADYIDVSIRQAANMLTAEDVIDTIQAKIATQTEKYRDKIANMRRVKGMLEWLRTGDPSQFNVPVTT